MTDKILRFGGQNALRASKQWLGMMALALIGSCGGEGGGGSPTPTAPPTATIGVSVTGLRAGQQLVLASGSDRMIITTNGSFSFATPIAVNASYAVTIATAPSAETCALNGATGTVQSASAIVVTLSCGPTILHSFDGSDGRTDLNVYTLSPNITLAADGNLYGTIVRGGTSDFGTIFRLTPVGQITVLHNFADGNADGKFPEAPLLEGPGGELYGTTSGGGAHGFGTVFKITRDGIFTLLHSFGLANGGINPKAGLIQSGGDFYGTTSGGGQFSGGTVFRVTSEGTVTVIYSFQSRDGRQPYAPLIEDGDGNLYGTTSQGGSNGGGGRVFKLTPSGTLTSLHDFNGADGSYLYGPIVRDNDGNLFGTTYSASPAMTKALSGNVFKLSASGDYSVLHQFVATDGANPVGGLMFGLDGNIYGTTSTGGTDATGSIFSVTSNGDFVSLHIFPGGAAGSGPRTRLVQDRSGVIYGTTSAGGANNMGTVFKF